MQVGGLQVLDLVAAALRDWDNMVDRRGVPPVLRTDQLAAYRALELLAKQECGEFPLVRHVAAKPFGAIPPPLLLEFPFAVRAP